MRFIYDAPQLINITLEGLADEAARESEAISNVISGTNYLDVLVTVQATLDVGLISEEGCINIYTYGSIDFLYYSSPATGLDDNIILLEPINLNLVEVIPVSAESGNITMNSNPFSIAKAFGGIVPSEWGIVVENKTGFNFLNSGCFAKYVGVYAE